MEGFDPRAVTFLIAFGVFFVALVVLIASHDYRRRRGLAALAGELGFSYRREDPQLLEPLEGFRICPFGSNRRISNVLQGEVERARVWLLDYSYFESGGRGSRNEYSLCVLRSADLALPYFYLRQQMPLLDQLGPTVVRAGLLTGADPLSTAFGAGDIDFPGDEPFSKHFVLQGKEERVRPLFDSDLRLALMRFAGKSVRFEGRGDTFLYDAGLPVLPKHARETIEQATAVFTLLLQRAARA